MSGGLSLRTIAAGLLLVAIAVLLNYRSADDAAASSVSVVIRCPPDMSGELRFASTSGVDAPRFTLPDACFDTTLRVPDLSQAADLAVELIVEGTSLQTLMIDPARDLRSDPEGRYIVFDIRAAPPCLAVGDL